MSMERGDQRASGGMLKPAAEDGGADENDKEGKVETQQQEWRIAGGRGARARASGSARDLSYRNTRGYNSGKNSDKKPSPRKHRSKGRNTEGSKWAGKGKEGEPGTEEEQEVFNQLKRYLLQDAPQDYVIPVVNRLNALARERRFLAYKTSTTKTSNKPTDEKVLREQWQDVPTAEQNERYQNLRSYWDLSNSEHGERLCQWIKGWIVQEDLQQDAAETRLQFCHFEGVHVTSAEVAKEGDGITSYLGAVSKGLEEQGRGIQTEEQKRMQILCTQPATSVTQLMQRTEEEDKALLMILNHEIEVPGPPPFLKQSMTSTELAIFTDIFLAIVYPLYAHLAPGQQFGDNMSRQAILKQIHAGMEAAPKQKQEVEDFKAAFSRIALNVDTRVVTVTFKGRQSASRWINWRMPFASKLLTLVDYDGKRERARTTHELVQLDYYEFTASVRKGDVSSRDMHWLLTQTLGLQVQEMTHPEADKKGLNDKEWRIIVKGAGCPQKLRKTAYIEVDQAAVMIHHHTINVNWPCSNCHSPEHPTRYCKTPVAELAQRKQLFDLRVQGPLSSQAGYGVDMLKKGSLPTTLVQLDTMLKQGANPERLSTSNKREGHVKPTTSVRKAQSPTKKSPYHEEDAPSLPSEWKQHRLPSKVRFDPTNTEAPQDATEKKMSEDDASKRVSELAEEKVNGDQSGEPSIKEGKPDEDELHRKEEEHIESFNGHDYDMKEGEEHDSVETGDDRSDVTLVAPQRDNDDETRGRSPARRIVRQKKQRQGLRVSNPTAQAPTAVPGKAEQPSHPVSSDTPERARDEANGAANGDRRSSQSPKRRDREEHGADTGEVRKEMRKTLIRHGGA